MEYMEEINSLLKTRWLGRKYVYAEELASTNSFGYELAEKGEPMGCVVVADVQTAGRGRRGRSWESPEGGLWFSLILRPAFTPQEAASLTTVTAVGLCRGLMYYPGLGAKIKWPNDILADGKKLGGILSEMKVDGQKLAYAVIGVGINISSGGLSSELSGTAWKKFSARAWIKRNSSAACCSVWNRLTISILPVRKNSSLKNGKNIPW